MTIDHDDAEMARTGKAARTVFIKTYGCQMNVYDSERMADLLAPAGYRETRHAENADIVILNTCHIREKAAEKVYSELGRLAGLKRARKARGESMLIGVAGCVAQAEGEEIIARAPAVDVVFGPQSFQKLPDLIAALEEGSGPIAETGFPAKSKFDELVPAAPEKTLTRGPAAFITVQEGCDKFCTFCVVPYTRGAEFSRPVEAVRSEAERLAGAGVREITLLGQNVNAYHGAAPGGGEWGLGRLIGDLAAIPGIDRIRYTTSHPRDLDDELLAAHRDVEQLMPYLHLPVQSGSDRILAAMNRKHSSADYLKAVERVRAARPDIALSSDFIVGFPGETDADFAATMALVETVGYAQCYSFKYSARPGTPAATMDDQVGEEVKAERLAALQELLDRQQRAFNEACEGRTLPVLLEREGRHSGQLVGRSPYLQAVHVQAGADRIGSIADIDITAAGPNSLTGAMAAARAIA